MNTLMDKWTIESTIESLEQCRWMDIYTDGKDGDREIERWLGGRLGR